MFDKNNWILILSVCNVVLFYLISNMICFLFALILLVISIINVKDKDPRVIVSFVISLGFIIYISVIFILAFIVSSDDVNNTIDESKKQEIILNIKAEVKEVISKAESELVLNGLKPGYYKCDYFDSKMVANYESCVVNVNKDDTIIVNAKGMIKYKGFSVVDASKHNLNVVYDS